MLSLRIRQVDQMVTLSRTEGREATNLKLKKTSSQIRWFYAGSTILFTLTSSLLLALSFPNRDNIDQSIYNWLFLAQMMFITAALIFGSAYLLSALKQVGNSSQMTQEKRNLSILVMVFSFAFLRYFTFWLLRTNEDQVSLP